MELIFVSNQSLCSRPKLQCNEGEEACRWAVESLDSTTVEVVLGVLSADEVA